MLTSAGCRARLARFRERIEGEWDAAVIHAPEHLLYLANFYALPNSLNVHGSSFLLVERDGPATLFTDNWLAKESRAAVDATVVVDWYTCERPALHRALAVGEALAKRLRALRVQALAAELGHLPVHAAAAAPRHLEVEPLLRTMREVKDTDEIEAIQRGIRTAEAVHAASRGLLEPGITELAYYGRLLPAGVEAAGAPFVMMCDLASGPRAAEGGGPPTKRVLEEGDLVILDTFPLVEGYRGDITNTLVVGGKPTREQTDLHGLVLAALLAGEALLQPGTPVRDVYQAVDSVFRAAPGKRSLVHHAGHAIGLGHPEAPEIVPDSDRVLEAGMVVTLEPGLYGAQGGGLRLEHDYLITENGHRRLSTHELGLA
ncbi:MAG TPA: Xaa-Pro peptidase family protein [Planctomycetota bacterium]|nr:Xaa-Pro peptidase family protein [Planctomycetota bacterium]